MELDTKDLEKKENINLEKEEKGFFDTTLGKIINTGIDFGLELLLPTSLEKPVMVLKDKLLQAGAKEKVRELSNTLQEKQKEQKTITSDPESILSQTKGLFKDKEVLNSISNILSEVFKTLSSKKVINKSMEKVLEKEKGKIMEHIEKQVDSEFSKQLKSINKLKTQISIWEKSYENQDLKTMKKQFEKIEKELEQTIPVENILKKARQIENIHVLLEKDPKKFSWSEEKLELAKAFA